MYFLLFIFLIRYSKIKRGAITGFRFNPDMTSKLFDYSFTYSKPYTRSVIFRLVMKALENYKYLIAEFLIDTDTVIRNRKVPLIAKVLRADGDNRLHVRFFELDGIADQ